MSSPLQPRSATAFRAELERKRRALRKRRRILLVFLGVAALVAGIWHYADVRRQLEMVRTQVTFSEGSFELRDGKGNALGVGERIGEGATLTTRTDGRVDVGIRGLGAIRVDEDSEVVFERLYRDGESREVILEVKKGRVFNKLRRLGESSGFELKAPSSQIVVRGTQFVAEADGSETRVSVRFGKVEVVGTSGRRSLQEGRTLVATANGLGDLETVGERERRLFEAFEEIKEFPEDIEETEPVAGRPWRSDMGMEFVPVAGLERTLVSKWETRRKDFEVYADVTGDNAGGSWRDPGFDQDPDHPAVRLNWSDAQRFCAWLTQRERRRGTLRPGECFRLPTAKEWNVYAAEPGGSPPELDDLAGKANLHQKRANADVHENSSPVGAMGEDALGLCDVWGNAYEWMEDFRDDEVVFEGREARGCSFLRDQNARMSVYQREKDVGFRVVLALKSDEEVALAKRVEEALAKIPRASVSSNRYGAHGYWVREQSVELRSDSLGESFNGLAPLLGLPVTKLHMWPFSGGNLSPLRGMELEELSCTYSAVSDLSPLRGMPLRRLDLTASTRIASLDPLADSPIEFLDLSHTGRLDLAPLARLPLKRIVMARAGARDFTPLNRIASLVSVVIDGETLFHRVRKEMASGAFWKAVESLEKFETDFAGFRPFAGHRETAAEMRRFCEWAIDGRSGPPPGAREIGGRVYRPFDGIAFTRGEAMAIADHVDGRLPVLDAGVEMEAFRKGVGADMLVGVDRNADGTWHWTTGVMANVKSSPMHTQSMTVLLDKASDALIQVDTSPRRFVIEWPTRESVSLRRRGLVDFGASWRYWDRTAPPPAGWEAAGFDASAWKVGSAPLGYGEEFGLMTELGFGDDPENKTPACFFRHTFDIADPKVFREFLVSFRRDDGAVLYLNGREIARSNMPEGEVLPSTLAAGTAGIGDEEARLHRIRLSPETLKPGANVLAASVHQADIGSSDLVFGLRLEGVAAQENTERRNP